MAVAEAESALDAPDLTQLAARHDVPPAILSAWLNYFDIGLGGNAKIESHLTEQQTNIGGHAFVSGWGPAETPNVAANASDEMVRIPGNLKPHGVVMHPSPTLSIVAGWQSPVTASVRIAGAVQHAHPECGNGVTWSLELRRGGSSRRLAGGIAHGGGVVDFGPFENISVRSGDVVALLTGPRDGNHSCDLTAVDLTITAAEASWDLAADVSPDILAGNPHSDQQGNAGVWHFFTEPIGADASHAIPADSLLAKWRAAAAVTERQALAGALQQLLQKGPGVKEGPDAQLYQQLTSLGGPLLSAAFASNTVPTTAASDDHWGLPRTRFGKQADGPEIDDASLSTIAPEVIEVVLPADLAAGAELVATGYLAPNLGADGSVQLQVLGSKPDAKLGLQPSTASVTGAKAVWSSDTEELAFNSPVIVNDGSAARARMEKAFDDFRAVFPAALCYTKIVPVDEVVTLTLFHREDEALCRLMLDEKQTAELDSQWAQLRFVSQDALTLVDAFEQLMEFATQDADPSVFAPLREPINARAAAFRQAMVDAEPRQLDALIDFAALAYRRPLTAQEASELRGLYAKLRSEELPHDEAFRFTLARVLVAPEFLYRLEESGAVSEEQGGPIASQPVNDWELATRLSYLLWSTAPDAELRALAASGSLRDPELLRAQATRMLKDPRMERLAREFACQWLHIYEFDALDEKSERHFPEFSELRGAMYQEAIRYFTDAFQNDASIVSFFDADHTFVNDRLAAFYGLPADTSDGDAWRRVSGLHERGRGGVLGFAATLAKQSGASRTSPILRGNWVSEVLLGEKLPKPPAGVPVLPDDDSATETMTVRQLVEKHVSDEGCAKCHRRIDPLGFALEEFDAIGRRRDQDTAGRAIDAKSTLPDGTAVEGLAGLRDYLVQHRRDALVRQFCRKLLGYALGRSVQLSDQPLLDEMMAKLAENDYRFSVAVECILRSNQFLAVRRVHHGGTEGGGGAGSVE
jgi:hypothetical protein